ncbi:hypothetical protein HOU03_gp344 [Caulobacter phage CcrSC]|uniref:Uncharacterized protein n=1 Tax=Caulobacter phage CcrSC TaxID=2283272 RepID=A0A385EDG6_9CAUD|nr:hypothetical protein HOU03_gp344 [Caulobacter phage CcrSC]AXQ69924.1 hypothetical protein CcrSC_gp342 [Caulobacter phage CcrSC]
MHAAIYMGFLAHACEATEGYDLLHDIGVLHEVGHLLLFDAWEKAGSLRNHYKATGRDKEIIAEVEALERRIPGFHPSWSGVEEHPAVPFPQRLAWARDRIAEPDWYAQDIPEDAPRVFFG